MAKYVVIERDGSDLRETYAVIRRITENREDAIKFGRELFRDHTDRMMKNGATEAHEREETDGIVWFSTGNYSVDYENYSWYFAWYQCEVRQLGQLAITDQHFRRPVANAREGAIIPRLSPDRSGRQNRSMYALIQTCRSDDMTEVSVHITSDKDEAMALGADLVKQHQQLKWYETKCVADDEWFRTKTYEVEEGEWLRVKTYVSIESDYRRNETYQWEIQSFDPLEGVTIIGEPLTKRIQRIRSIQRIQERTKAIKEELIIETWKPERVDALMDAGVDIFEL